ncbi:hypothetical protein D9619_005228 [Psilocybe cf. subviscida]|uniref:DUF5648 domain-containing protein n=1 Tax=Psilocybe cf. subviscida TaxID=2480587 RepID=A0A8H5BXU1_9AGAR|nr:hypothetical protein D9619_005228 [Psilocybe cf. subviscida]
MHLGFALTALAATVALPGATALPFSNWGNRLSSVSSSLGFKNIRSAQTCADPSLARTIVQGFSSLLTSHVIDFHYVFVNLNTAQGSQEAVLWSYQGAIFKAWPTQQSFTVPLFRLAKGVGIDYVFMVGPDAQTPPVLSGFVPDGGAIVAWVYDTPVCGSVPLMSAVFANQTDHYYTTDPDEHAGLLSDGNWSDGGIVAYVLPLTTS